MKLTDLEPRLLTVSFQTDTWNVVRDGVPHSVTGPREYHQEVVSLSEAQGIIFLCPACYASNGGAAGTHSIICWFRDRGVPDEATPGPARWLVSGNGLYDLSLSPSILLLSGCQWHGFITAGAVT